MIGTAPFWRIVSYKDMRALSTTGALCKRAQGRASPKASFPVFLSVFISIFLYVYTISVLSMVSRSCINRSTCAKSPELPQETVPNLA